MRKISVTTRTVIVAEGVPLHAELTGTELADLAKAVSTVPDDSILTTLTLIARAFDYDVERTGGGRFLLRKYYSDPTDLPDVTYGEVVRSLDSLLGIIDAYGTSPAVMSVDNSTFRLYESLTLNQQTSTHTESGLKLALADLDTAQRRFALQAAQNTVLDSRTKAVRQVLRHLIALHGKNVNFLWTTRTDQIGGWTRSLRPGGPSLDGPPEIRAYQPTFEYTIPSGQPDFTFQYPLNHGLKISLSGGGMRLTLSAIEQVAPDPSMRRSASLAGSSVNRSEYDPTVPTPQDRFLAFGMMSNRLASTMTLEALAESLSSEKTTSKQSVVLHIEIDPALDGKPVTIFGRDQVSGNQLIRLVSRVYGLQLVTADDKTYYVTTPRPRSVRNVPDLQAEIRRVIPPSLLRSMESQIERIAALTPNMPGMSDQRPVEERQKYAAMLAAQKRFMAAQAAANSWYFPADRRLIVLATAAVPTPASPPVSVASLGPEPSRLIALMSLTDVGMVAMRKLLNFVPPLCLTDPSTMRIELHCSEHGAMQNMTIRFASADGSGLVTHEGMSSFGRPLPK